MKQITKKEVKIMKKVLLTLFLVTLSVVLIQGYADAAVGGVCSGCHTMHNSQDNLPMTYDSTTTPNEKLLRGGCIGCHAQNTAANIVDPGGADIPQVLHTNGTDLAGGNFDEVISDETHGHNVVTFSGIVTDTNNATPPGYLAGYDPNGSSFSSADLVCAGTSGCHGDRSESNEFQAISGSHHGDDSILKYGTDFTRTGQGADGPTSYRYLNGVEGAEDSDWQATVGATDHNSYYAEVYGGRDAGNSDVDTISELCGQCHGSFHQGGLTGDDGIGSASPWVRHPTDVVIPNTGEYSSISSVYQDETPVGRTALADDLAASATGTVTAGTDTVMCISCHRAHGSAQPDMLRFSYTTQADGVGCLNCHTGKDAF